MGKDERKIKSIEPEPQILSEPVAMYQRTDIDSLKHRVVEEVMQIKNYEIIKKISDYLHEISDPPGQPPCQYSLDEMRERIVQAEKDIENGIYYTWDEIKEDLDRR